MMGKKLKLRSFKSSKHINENGIQSVHIFLNRTESVEFPQDPSPQSHY